ncbi:MAG: hypothetical protein JXA73_14225 [Acidobacteria bacterium]|nr:hypothetical protein [Acidobacteriota bacterium]
MLRKLVNLCIDWRVRQERDRFPSIDWRVLHNRLTEYIGNHPTFLEARSGRLMAINDETENEIVALAIACIREGAPPWESEGHAISLAKTLSGERDLDSVVLLSRDSETFVGYYVRVSQRWK